MKKQSKDKKKALELEIAKLRKLTADDLAVVAGGGGACPLLSCHISCGTSAI